MSASRSSNECSPASTGTHVLSRAQALELISVIHNTKHVLNSCLEILEEGSGSGTNTKKRKSWWGRHCWPHKRRVLYKHITIVTVALQLTNLIVLTLIDSWPRNDKGERPFLVASSCTMIALQLINLFFLILASGRLVKQIYRHTVNNTFLAQSYLATILLFAGIYTLTYRLERSSWKFINEELKDLAQVFLVYAKFLFYSISTATLCGSDNVLPVEWYNCIFAGFQMLLSFCYFASILGLSISPDLTKSMDMMPEPPRQLQHHHQQSEHKYHQIQHSNDLSDLQQQQQQQYHLSQDGGQDIKRNGGIENTTHLNDEDFSQYSRVVDSCNSGNRRDQGALSVVSTNSGLPYMHRHKNNMNGLVSSQTDLQKYSGHCRTQISVVDIEHSTSRSSLLKCDN